MSNNTIADVVLKDMQNRIGRFACTCYCGGFGSQMVLLSDIDRVLGEFATPPTPTPTSSPSREWLKRMAEAEAQCPSVTAGVPDAATAELERVTKERDSAKAEVERVRGLAQAVVDACHLRTHGFPDGDISDLDQSKLLPAIVALEAALAPTPPAPAGDKA